jgi:hypothetical protein
VLDIELLLVESLLVESVDSDEEELLDVELD